MVLWLQQLERLLASLAFPAAKQEIVDLLRSVGAGRELRWLVAAMPGLEFHFLSDVLSTARIALEMDIQAAWPERGGRQPRAATDATVAAHVRQRLLLCGQTNPHLIQVRVEGGTVFLEGRTPDVPRGVMAARVAAGVTPSGRVVNHLQVMS